MMDHTGIAQIMYEPPKPDGSTCNLMAASLRLGFKKYFKSARALSDETKKIMFEMIQKLAQNSGKPSPFPSPRHVVSTLTR